MHWFVSFQGNTQGPLSPEQVKEGISAGRITPGMHVRDEASAAWAPIEQSPFGSLLKSTPAAATQSNGNGVSPLRNAIGVLVLSSFFVLYLALKCGGDHDDETKGEVAKASPLPAPRPPPEPGDVMMTKKTLPEAIEFARVYMSDSKNEMSTGAAILARWSLVNLRWADLEAMTDMQYKEVAKDPAAFRGQKLCNRGSIVQISTDRSLGTPIYTGLMSGGWAMNLTYFVAVGSSNGVVQGADVRYCGIVAGMYTYDSADGGFRHAINSVGMFDVSGNGFN